jgi:hypothetical protein
MTIFIKALMGEQWKAISTEVGLMEWRKMMKYSAWK